MTVDISLSFWQYVVIVLFVLGVGVVSGRVLGVRRGFWRASIAGILGSFIGLVLAATVLGPNIEADDEADLLGLTFGFALLTTMVLSLILETLLRPRKARTGSRRTRIRAFATVGGRLVEVTRIARRHGLVGRRTVSRSALASADGGRRLRGFLEDCGGVFVKFGQIASTRPDLVPAPVLAELADLQSSAKKVPTDQVRGVIETELGRGVDEVFAEFTDEPLAAASIGQTHTAVLPGGRSVVVKIQRPGVGVSVTRDSAVLRWATRQLTARSEGARALGLSAISEELIRSVEKELDYQHEATNARTLEAARIPGVEVPQVLTELTTGRVLVMDRVAATTIADQDAVDRCGVPRSELARRLLSSFLQQVMVAGAFHADPHPGNILLDEAGTLWWIDFGAVGLIDPVTMDSLQLMVGGLSTQQPSLIARGLRNLAGSAGEAIDTRALESEVSLLLSEQLRGGGFDPSSLQQMIAVMRNHGFPVPPVLTLLGRALLTLEGTLRVLDPHVELAVAAQEQLGSLVENKASSTKDIVQKELLRGLPTLRSLPGLTEDVALQLRSGRVRLQVESFTGESRRAVSGWVDQALFAGVAAVGLLTSTLMLVGAALADGARDTGFLQTIGYIGLVLSSTMSMRVVAQVLRRSGRWDD